MPEAFFFFAGGGAGSVKDRGAKRFSVFSFKSTSSSPLSMSRVLLAHGMPLMYWSDMLESSDSVVVANSQKGMLHPAGDST